MQLDAIHAVIGDVAEPNDDRALAAATALKSHAQEHGLSNDALLKVLRQLIELRERDQDLQDIVISSLLPNQKISDQVVFKLVASLGEGAVKASRVTQEALISWVLMVYDLLENKESLHRVYAILFNLIDILAFSAPLCRLLVLLTRQENVTERRCDLLENWSTSVGNTERLSLRGLKQRYDHSRSTDFPSRAQSSSRQPCPRPNSEWLESIKRIWASQSWRIEYCSSIIQDIGHLPPLILVKAQADPNTLQAAKLSKILTVPTAKIDANYLYRLRLSSPVEYGLVVNNLKVDVVDAFLAPFLHRQIRDIENGDDLDTDCLDLLSDSICHPKTCGFQVMAFIVRLFELHPSNDFDSRSRSVMLQLCASIPIRAWAELYETVLRPVEAMILLSVDLSHLQALIELLKFYTNLLSNWTFYFSVPSNGICGIDELKTFTNLRSHTDILILSLFQAEPDLDSTVASIILDHIETQLVLAQPPLCLHLPPTTPITIYMMLLICPTLNVLSRVSEHLAHLKQAFERSPHLTLPTSSSGNLTAADTESWRTGEALASGSMASQVNNDKLNDPNASKEGDAGATNEPNATSPNKYLRPSADIQALNSELMDACNLLLRYRAFNSTDTHAIGCMLSQPLVNALKDYTASLTPKLELPQLLSLSFHPSLALFSISAFRELEKSAKVKVTHTGAVTQKSLLLLARQGGARVTWKDYRVHVLKWLEAMGVDGISNLGKATMRGLMGDVVKA